MPSPKAETISHLMWTHIMQETPSPPYPYLASQGCPMPFAIPTTYAFPMSHQPSVSQVSMKSEPTLITNKQCLWCVCRKGEFKEFCWEGKAEEYLNKQYLSWFSPGAAIPCLDEYCQHTLIWGSDNFKRHEQEVYRAPRLLSSPLQTHSCAHDRPVFDCKQAQQVTSRCSMFNSESQFTFVNYRGGNQMVMC